MAVFSLLLVAGLLLVPADDPITAYPSAADTRLEFEAVCRRWSADNAYFGRAVLDGLRAGLARPGLGTAERALLHGKLGLELLRLGEIPQAIAELERGLELARAGAPPDLLRRLRMNLAVSHLQLGEDENCLERHTARSCILPIAPEAVHTRPGHARAAGDLYLEVLAADPADPLARWLLNLARMISGDDPEGVPERYRLPAETLSPESAFPAWRDLAPALGVAAVDLSGGAAMDDFDGDGLLDLVSSTSDPCSSLKAFRNDGRGGFEDVTAAWGLDGQLGGLNLNHADYDNDGRLDLLVLRGAWHGSEGRVRNSLLRNRLGEPGGRFVDVTAAAGIAYPAYPTQTAAWGDYDNDGDLDLYVGNEATRGSTDPFSLQRGRMEPYPSQLFRNNGDGTFTDVARHAGVTNRAFTKGVTWGDYDDDGWIDLYVSTFADNRLFRNRGDGTFSDEGVRLGVTGPLASFPTWFFDFDNDGDLDLFAGDFSTPNRDIAASYLGAGPATGHPLLYRNEGGHFTEVARSLGLDRPTLPMGANHGDLDNDGWPDFYLGTGLPEFDAVMPNVMYRNQGGAGFEEVTFAGGFGHLQKGHGVAFGDLDNDGDQDLLTQMGGAYPFDTYGNLLFENPGNGNAWITLRLEGRQANRFGVGARIRVTARADGARRSVHALVGTGGSFGSSSVQAEIGLGAAEAIEEVVIVWPGSGTVQRFTDVALDRVYRAVEGEPVLEPIELPSLTLAPDDREGDGHRHAPGPGA